jgi:hypothetical protein
MVVHKMTSEPYCQRVSTKLQLNIYTVHTEPANKYFELLQGGAVTLSLGLYIVSTKCQKRYVR